jgi:hypothetical protein
MGTFMIVPTVDAIREFLEIAGDFTNPLEVVREAISNSIDAGADKIEVEFSAVKEVGGYVLKIAIRDNGSGMDKSELQSFFDLGNSWKRGNPDLIGEKGHGTKVFFNCSSIAVTTTKNGVTLAAEMERPYGKLYDEILPQASVTESGAHDCPSGTEIVIKGFNNNVGEVFTHDRLRDYIKWFTKFGSCEREFGQGRHTGKKLYLKGLDVDTPEEITFGHFFPEESHDIHALFADHVVRAPEHFCRKIVRTGVLRRYPFIRYEAIFAIEGNRVKQSYNRMIRHSGYTAPKGAYTVQERYGLWLCKDHIPIERRNQWISSKGSEFTKFHAFFNCQHLSLTANRGSVANTPPEILEDIREAVEEIYEEITNSDDWREMDWLESEAGAYLTLERERKDFQWRQDRATKSNVSIFNGTTLVEPTRESGVYALLVQLETLKPDLFPFQIVDYDTHSGIDVVAKMRDATPVSGSALYYVELKYFLERTMNHCFENIRYIVCWDTEVKNGDKVADLNGEERILHVVTPDPNAGGYKGYFLRRNFKHEIEVFVLKDYLSEKLNLNFRPRSTVPTSGA